MLRHSSRFWKNYKFSWFADLMFSYNAQNVGNIGHDHHNPKMFEKWYKIPNKGHRLYWRLHGKVSR